MKEVVTLDLAQLTDARGEVVRGEAGGLIFDSILERIRHLAVAYSCDPGTKEAESERLLGKKIKDACGSCERFSLKKVGGDDLKIDRHYWTSKPGGIDRCLVHCIQVTMPGTDIKIKGLAFNLSDGAGFVPIVDLTEDTTIEELPEVR